MLTAILSLLGLGGVGAAAFAFPPFGAALLGMAKAAGDFLAKIPWQAYVAAGLAALIAFLMISRSHALERAQASEARQAIVCQAVRDIASRPRQDCRLSELQIRAFGKSIADLEGALADQNSQIRELGRQSLEAQAQAVAAKRQAARAADQAESIAGRIEASSRQAPARPCAVSKALEEQWK